MEMKLDTLLEAVSLSVNHAQQTLDINAAEHFFQMMKKAAESGDTKISYAALMHHRPLLLEDVSIQMKAAVRVQGNETWIEPEPFKTTEKGEKTECGDKNTAEIVLTYHAAPPAEGLARMINHLHGNL